MIVTTDGIRKLRPCSSEFSRYCEVFNRTEKVTKEYLQQVIEEEDLDIWWAIMKLARTDKRFAHMGKELNKLMEKYTLDHWDNFTKATIRYILYSIYQLERRRFCRKYKEIVI